MRPIVERPAFSIRGRTALGAALLLGTCVGSDAALAAKVYRCGNAFQDVPCEPAKPAEIRPADKAAVVRDATATAVAPRATPRPVVADRIVVEPAAVVADVRR